MCAGAIINARIPVVVYGARDPKAGSVDSVTRLFDCGYNHHPQVISGVLEEPCGEVLRAFFRDLRQRKKREKEPLDLPQNVDK
jgi:tRNA(adenine34) deaminase